MRGKTAGVKVHGTPQRMPAIHAGRRRLSLVVRDHTKLRAFELPDASAIEDKFSEEGLFAMTQREDMWSALTRALLDGLEAQRVEHIWFGLNVANAQDYPALSAPDGWLSYVASESLKRPKRPRSRTKRKSVVTHLKLFRDL